MLWQKQPQTIETIHYIIVSKTNFTIVIGSLRAYLSRNRRMITQVSNYRFEHFVIGYPRDFRVNYALFNGFLHNVFYSFQNLLKALLTFSFKRNDSKDIFIPKFVICIRLISNWTSCRTIQGVIMLIISNRPHTSRSSDFEITCTITP